jgi:hypothetical protein
LNFGHIKLQLFAFHGRLGWMVVRIALAGILHVDAHSCCLLFSGFTDPRNISNGAGTLSLLTWYLQTHEARHRVLTQVNRSVVWILIILLLRTILVLELVDILANDR